MLAASRRRLQRQGIVPVSGLLNPGAGIAFGGGRVIVTLDPRFCESPNPQDATIRKSNGTQRNMAPTSPENL